MSTMVNLGRVVGRDALINGVNQLTLDASDGVVYTQDGENAKFTADLKSNDKAEVSAEDKGSITNREFAVGLDKDGKLSVNVPIGSGYGTCDTAAGTTEKAAVMNGYKIVDGGIVSIKFTNAVDASASLNINEQGAKPIYYKGAAIKAKVINAGELATFIYNGTNYVLIAVDSANLIKFGIVNNQYGYYNAAGTFVPFKSQADIDAAVAAAKVGTAKAAQVLSGYTFTNKTSSGINGGMADYSNNVQTITCNSNTGTQTYNISDGYHTSMKVNQTAPYNAGYAAGQSDASFVTGAVLLNEEVFGGHHESISGSKSFNSGNYKVCLINFLVELEDKAIDSISIPITGSGVEIMVDYHYYNNQYHTYIIKCNKNSTITVSYNIRMSNEDSDHANIFVCGLMV